MKKLILISTFLFCLMQGFSQVTIDSSDMPDLGDNYKFHTILNPSGYIYQTPGTNITWDFSSMPAGTTRNDTFFSVLATPYASDFNDNYDPIHKASISSNMVEGEFPIPSAFASMITISNGFDYFKQTVSNYAQVGLAATVYLPLLDSTYHPAVKFTVPDVIYKFPVHIGDADTTRLSFHVNLDFGQLFEYRTRINHVDAWGTVITPYRSYQVIRVKSDVYRHDSLSIRYYTLAIDTTVNTTHVEYKWLAKGYGMPVVQFRTTTNPDGVNTLASYLHDPVNHTGIESKNSSGSILVYPNPAKDLINISTGNVFIHGISISIQAITGKFIPVPEKYITQNNGNVVINIKDYRLESGIYLVRIQSPEYNFIQKVVVL